MKNKKCNVLVGLPFNIRTDITEKTNPKCFIFVKNNVHDVFKRLDNNQLSRIYTDH